MSERQQEVQATVTEDKKRRPRWKPFRRDQYGTQLWLSSLMVLVFPWRPEPTELFSSGLGVLIGLWLLLPWSSFDAAPAMYKGMAQAMPEPGWGILFAGVNTLIFGAVVWSVFGMNDREQTARLVRFRFWMSGVAGLTWVFTAASFAVGNWQALPTVTYVWLAITSLVTFIRLWWELGSAEETGNEWSQEPRAPSLQP